MNRTSDTMSHFNLRFFNLHVSNLRLLRTFVRLFAAMFVSVLFATQPVNAKLICETDNEQLRAMPVIKLRVVQENAKDKVFDVKLADNLDTRAAGFQRVCAETIAAQPILFLFPRATVPSFHMRNVVAPIDIAFIKQGGEIDSIQEMQPYSLASRSRPLYSSSEPVIAALEVHPGFFQKHSISANAVIHWRTQNK